jgi:hypothetical protein
MVSAGAIKQLALVETYEDDFGVIRVLDSFRITPSFGAVWYRSLDIGFPAVRTSSQENPGADGTYDETQFTGARSVGLTGVAINNAFGDLPDDNGWTPEIGWNSSSWFITELSAWASPGRRCKLYFTDDSGVARYMEIRGDSFSAPLDKDAGNYRAFNAGFINPSGKIFSFNEDPGATPDGRNIKVVGQTTVASAGRTYPELGPYLRDYPHLLPSGLVYQGSVSNGFVAKAYAGNTPMTNPRIKVTGPDGQVQSIGISGYSAPAGTVVIFDTINKTITASDGTSLDQYKTAPLQWPVLKTGRVAGQPRGSNQIDFQIDTGSTDAYVEIIWNDADLM